jgi:hypothetical protein
MNNLNSWTPKLGVFILVLSLLGGSVRGSAALPAANSAPGSAQAASAQTAPEPPEVSTASTVETNLADTAASPVPQARPAPPSVRRNGPVADVIKLVNSGVDQVVLLAYVTNSTSLFNPSAEEIIYLNDLGVPSDVVAAMLQHDQTLKQFSASPAPAPVAPNPAQFAPQPLAPSGSLGDVQPEPGLPSFPPESAPAADDMFYDSLAPYGTWVDVEGYGGCWQPTVAVVNPDWQPYFDGGNWVYTDCGWYWSSTYSWGWAPFHYGRWFRHHQWGWCWAPDRVWAPSWVCWRVTDGHCGWAPLPPGTWCQPGVGLVFHGRRVEPGFSFGLGVNSFVFVPWGHFQDHHLRPFGLPGDEAGRVFRQSVASTQYASTGRAISNHGLSAGRVAAATHTTLHPIAIHDVGSPVAAGGRVDHLAPGARAMDVYRPPPGAHPAPRSSSLDPAWRNPPQTQTQPNAPLHAPTPSPAWRENNSWERYQSPTLPDNRAPAYQAPAQAPHYNPVPAERPHAEFSAPPVNHERAYTPPAPEPRPTPPPPPSPAPAPAASSGGHSHSEKGGRS